MLELSVVIPVRDEEDNLTELVNRIVTIINKIGLTFEVIFVTDINKDNTLGVLRKLNIEDNRIKSIKLSNGLGQHLAVLAGLSISKGNAVVIMDGDLQDFPEDIAKLYEKYTEGFDVVYGVKEKKNDSSLRNLFSKTFIKVLNKLSDYKLDFNTCMFRIMSKRTVEAILRFGEREPSITGLISIINYPTTEVLVTSGKRSAGETKYNFIRQINLAISFLLSFSTKPLRIASALGFLLSSLSFIYLFIVILQKIFFNVGVIGWPTIIFLITFSSGLQLFFLGIIGEYIGKIFMETKNRPRYFIEEKIGL
ncbi:MAG: glycosyltransferase [Ignavibacteria bacterium]|nr:glycosyltransferase [Ignavibacteria bacterium]